jgi:outer membrane protein TolC
MFLIQNLVAAENLTDWIKNNVSQNSLVKASLLQIEEIEAKSQIAKTWASPFVDVSLGSKEQSSVNGGLYGFSVSQLLPILGKQNLLSNIFEEELEIAKLKYQSLKRQLTEQLVLLVFEKKIISQKQSLAMQRQKKLKLVDAYLKSRPLASPQINAQAQIVKQQLKKIESELLKLQGEEEKINQKMAFYHVNNPMPEIPWVTGEKNIFVDQNLNENLKNNFELLILERGLAKLVDEKSLISLESWSDPVLSGSYDQTAAPINEKTYFLGLGIGIPVWGGNQALVNSLDKKILKEKTELDYHRKFTELMLNQALTDYQSARKQIKLYQPLEVVELEEKFKNLELDFKKELIDLLTFIELDKQIAETADLTFQAQMELITSISKITLLTGREDLSELVLKQ